MKIKLFVFDFDGTALGGHKPYAQFPRPFVRFLDRLAGQGIRWATNTGWPLDMQMEVLRRSRVQTQPAMLIGQTGMRIGWIRAGRLVEDRKHEKQSIEIGRRFKKRVWPWVQAIFLKLLEKNLVHRIAFDAIPSLCIIDFTCRKSCERQAWRLVQPLLDSGDYYELDPNHGPNGMLLPRHMSKGDTLRKVLERLRIGPEQTIVAGDQTNDLHMFDPHVAKWMACPANADPLIKEAVRRAGGIVARRRYSWGIIEGVERILARRQQS